MKKLLVLAAGILQVPIIRKAHEMGIYVIAADGNKEAVGFQYADKSIVADITDENLMLSIARKEQIDGVIHPCSEVSMHVMGYINDMMHLNGVSRDVAVKATNKHAMREAFERYGASSPKSYLVRTVADAWQIFNRDFSDDGILKPSRNSGSRGVGKVSKGINFENFSSLYYRALNESRDHSVLLEQFIEGSEFSVEIIVWEENIHILAVTDKKTTDAPYFVELGHNQPSCYSKEIVNAIKTTAYEGIKALGINNCAAHAEVKVCNNKPYIMEIGARMGGDFISTVLTRLSTGVDMIAAAVNCALGIEPCLEPISKPQSVCIRYFCPKPGKLRSIGNTEILNNPQVYESEIYCKVGDEIPEVTSSLCRSGHVIVTEETPQKAIELADKLICEVKFITE